MLIPAQLIGLRGFGVGLPDFGYRKAGGDIERNAVACIGAQFRQPPLGQGLVLNVSGCVPPATSQRTV